MCVSVMVLLQVFPPQFCELPAPSLDLFDLDEHFSSERVRIAQLTNKCKCNYHTGNPQPWVYVIQYIHIYVFYYYQSCTTLPICNWIYKTEQIVTRTEIQIIHSCTVKKHQVCFHRWLFADPVKPRRYIIGPVGPLGTTSQNWWGARLLPMAVSIYPVDCVHLCHLRRAQHHCLCSNGRENPPSACIPCPLHPLTPHTYMTPMLLEGL